MILMFEMLEKVNVIFFFPSILFNETFWQAPYDKKLLIVGSNQVDWVGDNPQQRSFIFRDPYLLEVMRSIKLTYFSYSKLTYSALLEILTVKGSLTLNEFSSLGDIENNPLTLLNSIVRKISGISARKEDNSYTSPTLAKLSAAKFYTNFIDKERVRALISSATSSINYWENFFSSLETLDSTQNTNLLGKSNFCFTKKNEEELEDLKKDIFSSLLLRQLFENGKIELKVKDIKTYEPQIQYDYIFLNKVLDSIPTEVLIKHNNTVYNVHARLSYTKRNDEQKSKEVIQKLIKLTENQVKDETKTLIPKEELENLDFEILFKPYSNANAVELLENTLGLKERTIKRFSVHILSLLIKFINSLSPEGYIDIWDHNENEYSSGSLALMRGENGEVYTLVDYALYTTLLDSFEDISIEHSVKDYDDVISQELGDKQKMFITLENFIQYMNADIELWQKFFDINNFIYKEEVLKINKRLKAFEYLKKKKVYLLGWPTVIYNIGFDRFRKKVLSHTKLKDYIEKDNFTFNNMNSYENELILSFIPFIYKKAEKNKEVLISKDLNSPQNRIFYKFLQEVGFDK